MTSKHTPEPWSYKSHGTINVTHIIETPTHYIADVLSRRSAEDAARIVACVNACAGMDDPAAAIREAREALQECAEYWDGTDAPLGAKARAALAGLGGSDE